jgi:hypothetical protein
VPSLSLGKEQFEFAAHALDKSRLVFLFWFLPLSLAFRSLTPFIFVYSIHHKGHTGFADCW